jgi:hypothetical protein
MAKTKPAVGEMVVAKGKKRVDPVKLVRVPEAELTDLKMSQAMLMEEVKELRRRAELYDGDVRDDGEDRFDRLDGEDAMDAAGTWTGLKSNPMLGVLTESIPASGGGGRTMRLTESTSSPDVDMVSNDLVIRDINNSQRVRAIAASKWWFKRDGVAKNAINAPTAYAIGKGAKINTVSSELNRALMRFWKHRTNNMAQAQKVGFRKCLLEGELIPLLVRVKKDKGGDKSPIARLRFLPSDEIAEVYRDPDDPWTPVALRRTYFDQKMEEHNEFYKTHWYGDAPPTAPDRVLPDASRGKQTIKFMDDAVAGFYPLDGDGDVRGLPLLFSVMKDLRYLRDFVRGRVLRNRHAASTFMVRKMLKSSTSGKATPRYTRMPPAGVILNEGMDYSYRFISPEIRGGESKPDHDLIVLRVSAGTGTPPHILMLDSSSTNYSSIRIADTPFAQLIGAYQDFYLTVNMDFLTQVVLWAIEDGFVDKEVEVPEETPELFGDMESRVGWCMRRGYDDDSILREMRRLTEDAVSKGAAVHRIPTNEVPIGMTFPAVATPDPEKITDRVAKLRELGLISDRTSWEMVGIDPDVEKSRLALQRDEDEERRKADAEKRANDFGTGKDAADSGEPVIPERFEFGDG